MESEETVPTGNEELITSPVGKLLRAPFTPSRPPTMLLGPEDTLPAEVVGSINPKFSAATPPATFCEPEPLTEAFVVVNESVIAPTLMPTRPPRKLCDVPLTAPPALDRKI